MFDFSLSEEHELIRKTARDFGETVLRPAMRAAESARRVDESIASAFADLGFLGIDLPRSHGGGGLPPLAKVLVLEGLARGDASQALALDGLGPAAYPLVEMGSEATARIVESSRRGWVVIDDHGEHVRPVGDRFVGRWPWAPVDEVPLLVVMRGARGFVLRDGIELSKVKPCGLHAAGASELVLDAPIERTLDHARGALRARARLRLYAAALLVGVGAAALEYASKYAQERVAFGRPIAHHQGVAFLIAELATAVDAARLSAWRAAWALEQEGDPTDAAASALLDAASAAMACGEQGVQLLGGHGYMADHPSEKWMREARTIAQLWGGCDGALDALAERTLSASAKPGFAVGSWGEPSVSSGAAP